MLAGGDIFLKSHASSHWRSGPLTLLKGDYVTFA